jgi:hypothetical protein
MSFKTAVRTACAVIILGATFALAGTASATPVEQASQRIFSDLADNGRLDGHYTKAQINRALHTPSLRGYERPVPVRRPALVRSTPPVSTPERSLPFSGFDIALFAAVGGPLLLLGASLGRITRLRVRGT